MTSAAAMEVRRDDLSRSDVIALLEEHLRCMALASPPESRHALDVEGLRQADVTFWSIWDGKKLAGCGALKELDARHGEIKSMRTAYDYQRQGVASRLLRHLIDEAKGRGYRRLSLETGAVDYFEPARRLYARFGFSSCAPFASYREDPNSMFMSKELGSGAA
jgi:putative acetyltransferase